MIPVRVVGDEIRWMKPECMHDVSTYKRCAECDELTKRGRQLMAPLDDSPENEGGDHAVSQRR